MCAPKPKTMCAVCATMPASRCGAAITRLEQGLVGDEWTERTMSWKDYDKLFDELLRDVVQATIPTAPTGLAARTNRLIACDVDEARTAGDSHLWSVWHGREPFEWYRTRSGSLRQRIRLPVVP